MSTRGKTKAKTLPASLCWFEIPADNVERAKKFYSAMFGWKISKFPGGMEYWHMDTGGADASPDGGLMARKNPGQPIINYICVASVDKAMAKVKKLGGNICVPKTAVPGMGFFAVCTDTEKNVFGVWEGAEQAK